MKQLFFIIAAIAFISCCGTSKTQGNKQQSVNPEGRYQIVSVKDTVLASNDVIINFTGKNQVSGMSGCNNFSAEYTVNDGKVNFSPVTATKRYCEGEMEVEKMIFGAISDTEKIVSGADNEVFFVSEDGKKILRARKLE